MVKKVFSRQLCLRFLICCGLHLNFSFLKLANAEPNPLGDYSKLLMISSSPLDFIQRAFPEDKGLQAQFREYVKSKDITKIPKITLENQILKINSLDNSKITFEVSNSDKRGFKINNHLIVVSVNDDFNSLVKKIEALLMLKTSFWPTILLPKAYAVAPIVLYGAAFVVAGGVIYVIKHKNLITCDELAKTYTKKLKSITQKSQLPLARIDKVVRCSDGDAAVEGTTLLEEKFTLTYHKDDPLSQEGYVEQNFPNTQPPKIIRCSFFQGKPIEDPSNIQCTENGQPTSNEYFQAWYEATHSLTKSLGVSCARCVAEFNAALENGKNFGPSKRKATNPSTQ